MPPRKQPEPPKTTKLEEPSLIFTSVASLAQVFDCNSATIFGWGRRGCPGMAPRRYDLVQIIRWLYREWQRRNPPRETTASSPSDDDPMMGPVDGSPALEKYRAARARVAEIQALEAEKSVVRIDAIREGLIQSAMILRSAGDKLQRRCGPEAKQILDEHLDALERNIDKLFG